MTDELALPPPTRRSQVVPALPRAAKSPTAAEGIAAVVGTAVDHALGNLAPYGSRGDTLEAECSIEHCDPGGAVTRASMRFRFVGGQR